MRFQVLLTGDAVQDLEAIHQYISTRDSAENADHVLSKIEEAFNGLSSSPLRGPYPKELLALGIREYRECFFKPYRIIYQVLGRKVYVMLIADGRRNMQTLLQQRFLREW